MSRVRHSPIPLPAAILALSVAVCLGAAGPVEASAHRSSTQADQRETFESLLGAIQQAAKKLTDQLTGQAVGFDRQHALPIALTLGPVPQPVGADVPALHFLREALLNLPPPAC